MKFYCNTTGELKAALSHWPDDKPLIVDVEGDTFPLIIGDWTDETANSLDWPVAVDFKDYI